MTVQGDVYDGEVGQFLSIVTSLSPPYTERVHTDARIRGGDVLGRWEGRFSDRSDLVLQVYYDRSEREEAVLEGAIRNTDIDFQHRFEPGRRLETVWGLGYRSTTDRFDGSFTMSFEPGRRRVHLFSGFLHQEVSLIPDRLRLTLGSKFEHNSYTGFEMQPNGRFWWSPARGQTVWGAVSRAVRTPSRSEHDIRGIVQALPPDSLFLGSPLTLLRIAGEEGFRSEAVRAFEVGYRASASDRFRVDLAVFYNLYDDLRTNEPDISSFEVVSSPPHLIVPIRTENRAAGRTYGVEAAADWQVSGAWRLHGSYSYLRMELEVDEDSSDTATEEFDGENPKHQLRLRSYMDLSDGLRLNLTARYVDRLPALDIPGYFTLDARLGWRLNRRLELSLVGQNLLESPRTEFVSAASSTLPAKLQAGVYGAITWGF